MICILGQKQKMNIRKIKTKQQWLKLKKEIL